MIKPHEQWIADLAEQMLPEVRNLLNAVVGTIAASTESPIELKLATALFAGLKISGFDVVLLRDGSNLKRVDDLTEEHKFVIVLQYPWRNYRSDLLFTGTAIHTPVLVECDGHDFHERTKEQAERDRTRDMHAQQDGYSIVRFTGSRIHREAYRCVYDLLAFVRQRQESAA